MKRSIWKSLLIAAACGACVVLLSGCPLPTGELPKTSRLLSASGDVERSHAWNLLASYLSRNKTQQDFDPEWRHWADKCSLPAPHLSRSCVDSQHGMQITSQSPAKAHPKLL